MVRGRKRVPGKSRSINQRRYLNMDLESNKETHTPEEISYWENFGHFKDSTDLAAIAGKAGKAAISTVSTAGTESTASTVSTAGTASTAKKRKKIKKQATKVTDPAKTSDKPSTVDAKGSVDVSTGEITTLSEAGFNVVEGNSDK